MNSAITPDQDGRANFRSARNRAPAPSSQSLRPNHARREMLRFGNRCSCTSSPAGYGCLAHLGFFSRHAAASIEPAVATRRNYKQRWLPVWRRKDEEDFTPVCPSVADGQHCWLRLLRLVEAGAGAVRGSLPARPALRSVRHRAGHLRRSSARRPAVRAAAAMVIPRSELCPSCKLRETSPIVGGVSDADFASP